MLTESVDKEELSEILNRQLKVRFTIEHNSRADFLRNFTSGHLYTWGANHHGELGHGDR